MYGLGLPVLFPVAVASFLMLYFVEKSMLYWSYRQPPMYDDRLNASVLKKMTYAPLLFLIIGYWMLSNVQLLSNTVYEVEYRTDAPRTGHHWYSVFLSTGYAMSPALPLLILFWVLLIAIFFRNTVY